MIPTTIKGYKNLHSMYLKSFIESAIIIVIVKLLVEWGGGHMAERSKIVG